jgi:hypothetical protein
MTDSTTIYLLIPEIVLIAAATLIYLAGAFWQLRAAASWLALVSLVVAGGFLYVQDTHATSPWHVAAASASGPLTIDLFGHVARWVILTIGLALVLMTSRADADPQRPEEAASILLMLAGLMLVAAAGELILIFVGLELVSIPTYVVLYVGRHDARGQEAASKYFFLSILSSAVLLYGFSFLYGVGGSTRLSQIDATLSSPGDSASLAETLVPLGLLFTFGGLAFRLTAAPFHFYAPDVYQGTSNANAGLLSTLPKIAGLLALARIGLTALPGWEAMGWKVVLVVSVVLTAAAVRHGAPPERSSPDASASSGPGGGVGAIGLIASRQQIVSNAFDLLRKTPPMLIGPEGAADYAGALWTNSYSGGRVSGRTLTRPDSSGGRFGFSFAGVALSEAGSDRSAVYGLVSDDENRSNVGVFHMGDRLTDGPVTLRLQVHDICVGSAI